MHKKVLCISFHLIDGHFTPDIFQLRSYFYVLTDSFFSVSVTVSVIFHFSVTVIVRVKLIIFFSHFVFSITITVNLNNTAMKQGRHDWPPSPVEITQLVT